MRYVLVLNTEHRTPNTEHRTPNTEHRTLMNISVELTLTPLQDDFEPPIINFIRRLRNSGFTVLENPLSTQVYGEYDGVMELLQTEIKDTFENTENVLLQMKIVKSDRSDYEPHF